MRRNFGLKSRAASRSPQKENDLEGRQDMGGKHGGQAGMPEPTPRPHATKGDGDVVHQSDRKSKRQPRGN